jgi:hypothetical protein
MIVRFGPRSEDCRRSDYAELKHENGSDFIRFSKSRSLLLGIIRRYRK